MNGGVALRFPNSLGGRLRASDERVENVVGGGALRHEQEAENSLEFHYEGSRSEERGEKSRSIGHFGAFEPLRGIDHISIAVEIFLRAHLLEISRRSIADQICWAAYREYDSRSAVPRRNPDHNVSAA